jgi:hypothetical protein
LRWPHGESGYLHPAGIWLRGARVMARFFTITLTAILFFVMAQATIINIPSQYSTIQAGLDAATYGDTVLVASGQYLEAVNFWNTGLTLASHYLLTGDTADIDSTIIDGGYWGTAVFFSDDIDQSTTLIGFTIRHGWDYGISSVGSPIVKYNIIEDNYGPDDGNGAGVFWSIGYMTLEHNIIRSNFGYRGAAIYAEECSGEIHHNLIIGNTSDIDCSAIMLDNCDTILVYNNTICDNLSSGTAFGAIYAIDYVSILAIYNNIVTYNSNGIGSTASGEILLEYNDVFNNVDSDYYGISAGVTDISLDPLFTGGNPYDYHLTENSPCIDAGSPSSEPDPDGSRADMGVYYYSSGGCNYTTGDINGSGITNGVDVTYGVGYFKGGAVPPVSCACGTHGTLFVAGDVNGDCNFNGIDIAYFVTYLKGGTALRPCPDCPSGR